MNVLLDTNIVLDYLLKNAGFVDDAEQIWNAHLADEISCYINATTVTNVHYVASSHAKRNGLSGTDVVTYALQAVDICLAQLFVVSVDLRLLKVAYSLAGNDFEDNLQIVSALDIGADVIVTRDQKGFALSSITVMTPDSFVKQHLDAGSK